MAIIDYNVIGGFFVGYGPDDFARNDLLEQFLLDYPTLSLGEVSFTAGAGGTNHQYRMTIFSGPSEGDPSLLFFIVGHIYIHEGITGELPPANSCQLAAGSTFKWATEWGPLPGSMFLVPRAVDETIPLGGVAPKRLWCDMFLNIPGVTEAVLLGQLLFTAAPPPS